MATTDDSPLRRLRPVSRGSDTVLVNPADVSIIEAIDRHDHYGLEPQSAVLMRDGRRFRVYGTPTDVERALWPPKPFGAP